MQRRKKNPIWDYFEKSETDNSKAECKLCNKLYSLGSSLPRRQTTVGLKHHLSKYHSDEFIVVQRKCEYDKQIKKGSDLNWQIMGHL